MMTQPELASDDIISRLHLPTLRKLLDDLSLDYDQLENNVASQADLHKKGNNPPSYTNVRSLGEHGSLQTVSAMHNDFFHFNSLHVSRYLNI